MAHLPGTEPTPSQPTLPDPAPRRRTGFFSPDNVHRAGWSALIALVAFVAGLFVTRGLGPQRVIVETAPPNQSLDVTPASPTVSSGVSSEDIRGLTSEMRRLREASEVRPSPEKDTKGSPASKQASRPAVPSSPPPDTISPKLQQLTEEVTRLTKELANQSQKSESTSTGASGVAKSPSNPPPRPSFSFPKSVKGYRPTPFLDVIDATCPLKTLAKGEPVKVSFSVVNNGLPALTSPLFVRVARMRGKDYELQIIERLLEFQPGTNQLSFQFVLEPAEYELSYGFYLRSEIDQEFPPFYGQKCLFVVN